MMVVATTAAPTAATNAVKATATNSSAAASATRTLILLIIYEFDDDDDDDVPLDESSLDDAATCSSCWASFGSLLDNDVFPFTTPLSWSLFTSLSLSIRFANLEFFQF